MNAKRAKRVPIDELFFTWLYDVVASPRITNPNATYWNTLNLLYRKEFVWFIPNDANRSEDGKELRREFIQETGLGSVDPNWLDLGCSVLEMMIALSGRLSFQDDRDPVEWFWELFENLSLDNYPDSVLNAEDDVNDILDQFLFRRYLRDGTGGLFPLKRAAEDQTKVELWYQLSAYLAEKEG